MEIRSLKEYLGTIKKLAENYTFTVPPSQTGLPFSRREQPSFLYRGHGDDRRCELEPGVLRWLTMENGSAATEFSQAEYNILDDFISEACLYNKDVPPENISAWLEIAQHFGVPTRLLDFTQNPLVALYFACADTPEQTASVWILNEPAYNRYFFGIDGVIEASRSQETVSRIIRDEIVHKDHLPHVGNPAYIQAPWIYKPYYREERMNMQSSVFMLWGADRRKLTDLIPPEHAMTAGDSVPAPEKGILARILVPRSAKKAILEELDLCGVNGKFIFPGIEGVGRYIRAKYSRRS